MATLTLATLLIQFMGTAIGYAGMTSDILATIDETTGLSCVDTPGRAIPGGPAGERIAATILIGAIMSGGAAAISSVHLPGTQQIAIVAAVTEELALLLTLLRIVVVRGLGRIGHVDSTPTGAAPLIRLAGRNGAR